MRVENTAIYLHGPDIFLFADLSLRMLDEELLIPLPHLILLQPALLTQDLHDLPKQGYQAAKLREDQAWWMLTFHN